MEGARIEFVEGPAPSGADADELTLGRPAGGGGRPPGRLLVLTGVLVAALVATVLVTRVTGGDDAPRPQASATTSTPVTRPVFGLIGLPRAIGTASELVAASSGDVVWMLDHGAGIVRIEGGTVTRTQLLESQATAIAVNPGGTRLYVATAAGRPTVQVLDATTLTPGRSQPLEGSIQAMAVSTDAVWAASGSRLFRLDLDSLEPLATLPMPGVVLTTHLRLDTEQASGNQQILTGLVTGSTAGGPTVTRFLRVDPLTQRVRFGDPLPNDVEVATAQLLTWVTYRPGGDEPVFTAGYASVLASTPAAVAAPPLQAGSRIYDGGGGFAAFLVVAPDSSVVSCRDPGGVATSEVDVAPAVPDAVVTGPVLRTDTAFYIGTDRGLVRSGVGACL